MRLWAVLFWLLVWQAASMLLGQEILLASPLASLIRLAELVTEAGFWRSIGFSAVRIIGAFAAAVCSGVVLAALSAGHVRIRELMEPLAAAVKATPVASFIILTLLWIKSGYVPAFISFLL